MIAQPIIQIDTREQSPLAFSAYPSEIVTLPVGDYGIRGFSDWSNPAIILERKSLNDLCNSLGQGRDRFLREVEKMRQFGFRALVIESTPYDVQKNSRSQMHPNSIFATLDAIMVRAGVHVLWAGDSFGAARQVESLVRQFVRGIEKQVKALEKADLQQSMDLGAESS